MVRIALLLFVVSVAGCAFAEGVLEIGAVPLPILADNHMPPGPPERTETQTPRQGKYSKYDVEICFRDGTIIRGRLKGIEQLSLKTSFGTLIFPLEDLQSVAHVGGATDVKTIAAAITHLKGTDSAARSSAEETLVAQGAAAVEPLFDARIGADKDLKACIDMLLKKLLTHEPVAELSGDTVKAAKFEARGTLQGDGFQLASKLGDLAVKLSDVESIRWLSAGDSRSMDLDASTAMSDWIDTGVDLVRGQIVGVKCSGTVNLFRSFNASPNGNPQWNSDGFVVGSVIGKLGTDGTPFAIGERTDFRAESSSRLYAKIFCTEENLQSNQRSIGHFTLQISSGPLGEMGRPKE